MSTTYYCQLLDILILTNILFTIQVLRIFGLLVHRSYKLVIQLSTDNLVTKENFDSS